MSLRRSLGQYFPAYFIVLFAVFTVVSLSFVVVAPLLLGSGFYDWQQSLYVSQPVVGDVEVSGLGFILPLVLTVVSVVLYSRNPAHLRMPRRTFLTATTLLAALVGLSVALPLVTPWGMLTPAGGTNALAALSITGYLAYMIYEGEARFAVGYAFSMGFVLCLVSDLAALEYARVTVFGGNGLFDGDFFEPIALLIGTWTTNELLTGEGPKSKLAFLVTPQWTKVAALACVFLGTWVLTPMTSLVPVCGPSSCFDALKLGGLGVAVLGFSTLVTVNFDNKRERRLFVASSIVGVAITGLSDLAPIKGAAAESFGLPVFFSAGPLPGAASTFSPLGLAVDCIFWSASIYLLACIARFLGRIETDS